LVVVIAIVVQASLQTAVDDLDAQRSTPRACQSFPFVDLTETGESRASECAPFDCRSHLPRVKTLLSDQEKTRTGNESMLK